MVAGDKKRIHTFFRINKTDLDKANQLKQTIKDELDAPGKHDVFAKDLEVTISEEDPGSDILLVQSQTRFNSNHGLFKGFIEQLEHNPQFSASYLPGSRVTIHDCPHHRIQSQLHPCVETIIWEK